MEERYLLAHVTTTKNAEKIISSKQFCMSKHTPQTIQWLGDGVYFWDGNDKGIINELGKNLVQRKSNNKNEPISKIEIILHINEDKHLNLDDNDIAKVFENFLIEINKEELIDMLKMYKGKERLTTKEKNKLGKIFGTCINAFKNHIENEMDYKVDMISYTFYSGAKKSILFSKEGFYNKQFCIKNLELINNLNEEDYYCISI